MNGTTKVPLIQLRDDYTALQYIVRLSSLISSKENNDVTKEDSEDNMKGIEDDTEDAVLDSLLAEELECQRVAPPLSSSTAPLVHRGRHWRPSSVVLRRHRGTTDCFLLALPRTSCVFRDLTLRWAIVADSEMRRQYAALCEMARLQTIGGGWASLRRADKALECTLRLYAVAQSVWDEDTAGKCRLFVGWAQLWNGNRALAQRIFEAELRMAEANNVYGDNIVHIRRCQNALANATRNPTLQNVKHRFEITDCWASVFSAWQGA